jgi:salicylate hydroxylase
LWLGAGAHLVHYPVARGALVNIVATVDDAFGSEGWNIPGDPTELAGNFASWSSRARDIVAVPAAWQKHTVVTVDPLRPWHGDRVVLIGDAAHGMAPFLAQGAAMAVEDAAVLATALAATRDTELALRNYVAARQPRAAAVARASLRAGKRFHMRGPSAVVRNLALRVAGRSLILAQNRSIYAWRAPTAPAAVP